MKFAPLTDLKTMLRTKSEKKLAWMFLNDGFEWNLR